MSLVAKGNTDTEVDELTRAGLDVRVNDQDQAMMIYDSEDSVQGEWHGGKFWSVKPGTKAREVLTSLVQGKAHHGKRDKRPRTPSPSQSSEEGGCGKERERKEDKKKHKHRQRGTVSCQGQTTMYYTKTEDPDTYRAVQAMARDMQKNDGKKITLWANKHIRDKSDRKGRTTVSYKEKNAQLSVIVGNTTMNIYTSSKGNRSIFSIVVQGQKPTEGQRKCLEAIKDFESGARGKRATEKRASQQDSEEDKRRDSRSSNSSDKESPGGSELSVQSDSDSAEEVSEITSKDRVIAALRGELKKLRKELEERGEVPSQAGQPEAHRAPAVSDAQQAPAGQSCLRAPTGQPCQAPSVQSCPRAPTVHSEANRAPAEQKTGRQTGPDRPVLPPGPDWSVLPPGADRPVLPSGPDWSGGSQPVPGRTAPTTQQAQQARQALHGPGWIVGSQTSTGWPAGVSN